MLSAGPNVPVVPGDADDRSAASTCANMLVADGTFGDGPDAESALCCARCCMCNLYFILASALLICFGSICRGHVEIVDHRMKYSKLEVPSVAICPWSPGTSVVSPHVSNNTTYALKFKSNNVQHLQIKPVECRFDRLCQCIDLSHYSLEDDAADSRGPTGMHSEGVQNFRERIEIRTTLEDPSVFKTLKYGFYDSQDHRPSWYYIQQWHYVLGQLRLDSWMVSETNEQNFRSVLRGDFHHLDRRHFYSFPFSSTDASSVFDESGRRYTRVSYEFRNFFVMETISSSSTVSLFSIAVMLMLFIATSNLLMLWEMMFPVKGQQMQTREIARPIKWMAMKCGMRIGTDVENYGAIPVR